MPPRWHALDRKGLAGVRRLILTIIGGFAIIWLGQFVFQSEFAARATARLVAPVLAYAHGTGSHEKSVVVLVDEPSLSSSQVSWPPRYGYHANILEGIAQYGPKAIMIDLLFVDRRDDPSIARLADTLCDLHRQGIAILVAADPTEGSIGLRPELDKGCLTEVGVQYDANGVDRVAWDYALYQRASDGGVLASAALAAYRASDAQAALPAPSGMPVLSLVWGVTGPNDANGARPAQLVFNSDDEPVCEVHTTAGGAGALGLWFASAKPACAFNRTLRAYQLRSPDEAQERVLQESIADRVVFYGADLAGTGDYVNSPLHGRIPGVYLHAMAFDNLATYGEGWKRSVSFGFELDKLGYLAQLALMIALSTLLIGRLRHMSLEKTIDRKWKESRARPQSRASSLDNLRHAPRRVAAALCALALTVILFLGSAAVALVIVAIGHWFFNLGVLSYIEVVAASLVAEFFDVGEKVDHILIGEPIEEEQQQCPANA